jgi:tRNA(fMet)-specific endonuclease VapC
MLYLLDTNILSEARCKRPNLQVLNAMERNRHHCAIAATTWHELQYGCQRLPDSRRKRKLAEYLESVCQTMPILPYDAAAAQWHAEERSRLASEGRMPPFADAQIAAIAITQNLTLVTRNVRDFRMFDRLSLENWFDNPE